MHGGRRLLDLVRRAARKPPRVLARRAVDELRAEADRFFAPGRARRFDDRALLKETEDDSLDSLWRRLASRPYPAYVGKVDAAALERLSPGTAARIVEAADRAVRREVDLLGSGPVRLGTPVEWNKDPKTGKLWPNAYFRDIEYNNPDLPSDVKMPWEISRLQWLIPAGQAYLLTKDERYAAAARELLEDWMDGNPYAQSVNWACTMEAALRILSWTWFFHAFHDSVAWRDEGFRSRFLRMLYLHGSFTERHIERSEVNGNHYTADAAGLVFAGLFFGRGREPERWASVGWEGLVTELPLQVTPDGVDYEASSAYHRLVLELFFLPARYRLVSGLEVPTPYSERVLAMASFTAAYTRHDGSAPLWGDADDARALPFGHSPPDDHRYLLGLVGLQWDAPALRRAWSGPLEEIAWVHGPEAASGLTHVEEAPAHAGSVAFEDGGVFVMRGPRDHVFIDCGPVGLAGRGGHGHCDCLSFEAYLDGARVVTDSGAYVYTASYEWRNRFRSTAFHNTPRVDGEEQNRMRPDELWTLRNDALPQVLRWLPGARVDLFRGSHRGYDRLTQRVRPLRTIALDHERHRLVVHDAFEGEGEHEIRVPFHLAPGIEVRVEGAGTCRLEVEGRTFVMTWGDARDWSVEVTPSWVSPSYGVRHESRRVEFVRSGPLRPLLVVLAPIDGGNDDVLAEAAALVAEVEGE